MNSTFWRFTLAIGIALLLPVMVQEGMFLDGVSYAAIARNMAVGLGDFSHPHYTATLYPVCYEQPPLALWIQSLFFRLFGDHFWVERLFSCSMATLTGLGIYLNCRLLLKQEASNLQAASWLSVLFWISTPLVFWAYQNNLLECTMSVFVQFSIFLALKFAVSSQKLMLLGAACLSACAVLCKGPVGFFPIITPIAVALVFPRPRILPALMTSGFLLICTLGLLGVMIWAIPDMEEYLDYYLNKQLFSTLSGQREKSPRSSLYFIVDLVSQIAIPAVGLFVLLAKSKFQDLSFSRSARFCIALGLAGTLPLVLTPKQSVHYLLPAIPFFALGFAFECSRRIKWGDFIVQRNKWISFLSTFILVVSLGFSLFYWGKSRRDVEKIKAVKAICTQIGKHAVLSIPEAYSGDWLLAAYFARFGNISLDSRELHEYYLGGTETPTPTDYHTVPLEISGYKLWKRK